MQAPSAFLGRFDTEDTISVCLSKVRDNYIICNASRFLVVPQFEFLILLIIKNTIPITKNTIPITIVGNQQKKENSPALLTKGLIGGALISKH